MKMKSNSVLVLAALLGACGMATTAAAQNANLDRDRAYAAEMVADAKGRGSSLQGGVGAAGYDKSFYMSDATGANRLNIAGFAQFRFTVNSHDEDAVAGDDSLTTGFSNGAIKVAMSGNVGGQDTTFRVRGNFIGGSSPGEFTRDEAWVKHAFEGGWSIRGGQVRLPLLREFIVEDRVQLAMDRAGAGWAFGPGFSQGVEVEYRAESFRVVGVISDGLRTANTPFDSAAESDFALTGRVEVKIAGVDWKRFDDFTSWRTQDFGVLVGGAAHYQSGGETVGTADVDTLAYSIDTQIEGAGWNGFAAFYGNTVDADAGADTDTFGGVLQAGVFISDQTELFGRLDAVWLDDDAFADADDSYIVTAGANYYMIPESHAVKLTGEVGWALESTDAIFGGTSPLVSNQATGFLGQSEDNEFVFRVQVQVSF